MRLNRANKVMSSMNEMVGDVDFYVRNKSTRTRNHF
jgi:hypothetical protein